MEKSIELNLLKQVEQIAEMYKSDVTPEKHEELCSAIKACYEYVEDDKGDWWDLYEIVQGDDGLWNYEIDKSLSRYEQDMWGISVCILSCICLIGCIKEHDSVPQDLEIVEENIPRLVEFMENTYKSKEDSEKFNEFWRSEMCY